MKWLIVEDALRDRKGHWLEYVSTFVRELRALGDEVVVLCDQRAQGFVMEQTGARPVLPESIWHRMGEISAWGQLPLLQGFEAAWSFLLGLGWTLGFGWLLLAGIDFGWQWWTHERRLLMSDSELREELKESQGDPQLRAKRRRVVS